MGVVALRVPGVLGYRHLAVRFIGTACKMAAQEAGDDDLERDVVSAFGEAFNNVVEHGYGGVKPGPVQVEVDWDDERFVVTITDEGRTFDPTTVAPPDLDELPESGMGLFIMRACMDDVRYEPGPPNVLRLVKLRRRRDGMLPPPPEAAVGEQVPGGVLLAGPAPVELGPSVDGDGDGDRVSGIESIPSGPAEVVRPTASKRRSSSTRRTLAAGTVGRLGEASRRK